MGEQVRGDGEEACRIAKGSARPRGLYQQRLRIVLGTGVRLSGDVGFQLFIQYTCFIVPFLLYVQITALLNTSCAGRRQL